LFIEGGVDTFVNPRAVIAIVVDIVEIRPHFALIIRCYTQSISHHVGFHYGSDDEDEDDAGNW
jgi:hypothetical protein